MGMSDIFEDRLERADMARDERKHEIEERAAAYPIEERDGAIGWFGPREDRMRDVLEGLARRYVDCLSAGDNINRADEDHIDGLRIRHLIPGLLAQRGLCLVADFAKGAYVVRSSTEAR